MQPEILLALSASSVRPLLAAKDPRCPDIYSLPQFVATDLQLRGLNLPTDLLVGFGLPAIDRLRDEADRAHCPVLLLTEETPIDFTDRGPGWLRSLDRLKRLGTAANRLGCPSIALRASGPATDAAFEATAAGIKIALRELDRFELMLLLAPTEGLTFEAAKMTELIKKIGGFRIGSFPSFAHAHATGNLDKTLRTLAPYASAISASIRGFEKDGAHDGFSLEECMDSIRRVGFVNTLTLEFVGRGEWGATNQVALASNVPSSEPVAVEVGATKSSSKKSTAKTATKTAGKSAGKSAGKPAVDVIAELETARRILSASIVEPELAFDEEEE